MVKAQYDKSLVFFIDFVASLFYIKILFPIAKKNKSLILLPNEHIRKNILMNECMYTTC